ncbi:hypothetical protein L1049_019238 [Liquidambar formosana]|uniref:Uncharacterized protein n=1 Tax=Liquidambar formosana TaxID=63359 RepID=A0AAP0RD80_LIQFO
MKHVQMEDLDRSSGVIQDHGSGLGQDSCGSTKPGDYRHVDPREVESRRLYGQDFPAADLTYGKRIHYTGNLSDVDDTSSESSSALQDRFFPQTKDPCDMETSRYLTQNGAIMPINAKGDKNKGSMRPSGYLKVKGNIEHAAITAVKRQLGRHYREDGPPLGIEFQPLPPGAFETPVRDPVHEPYYVSDPILPPPPGVSGIHKQSSLSTRDDVCNSKISSQDSYMKRENFRTTLGSDSRDNYSHHQFKENSSFPNYGKPFPVRNTFLDMNEDSAGETSVYNGKRSLGMRSKGLVGLRLDSVSDHHLHPYGEKITSEQTEPYLHKYDDVSPKIVQREHLKSKPSNVKLRHSESLDMEERGLSRRLAKEKKLYGGRIAVKEYHDPVGVKMRPSNEMALSKRVRDENPKRDYVTKAPFSEMLPWSNQIKGSATEIPSSFSEDETAETSTSMD